MTTLLSPRVQSIRRVSRGGVTTITIVGEISPLLEPELALALASAVDHPEPVTVIECVECEHLSGGSVSEVIDAADRLHRLGGRLFIANASTAVRASLQLLGAPHLVA